MLRNNLGKVELKPLEYELPQAPKTAIESWMPRLSAIAVVTGLFAATEAQLLSSLPDANTHPHSASVAIRFFAYSGLFLNIGATLSAVLLLIAIASLPTAARQVYISCSHGYPRNIFHGQGSHAVELNSRLVDGEGEIYMLRAFGLARGWGLLLRHCVLCFLVGWICAFLHIGIALWLVESNLVAAIVMPVAALAGGPPFIIYLFFMDSAACEHCIDGKRASRGSFDI